MTRITSWLGASQQCTGRSRAARAAQSPKIPLNVISDVTMAESLRGQLVAPFRLLRGGDGLGTFRGIQGGS